MISAYLIMPIIEFFLTFSDSALLYYPNLFFVIIFLVSLVCLYCLIKIALIFFYILDRAIIAEFSMPRTHDLTVGALTTSLRVPTIIRRSDERSILVRGKINNRKKAFVKKYHKFYSFIFYWVKTIRVRTAKIAHRVKNEILIEE